MSASLWHEAHDRRRLLAAMALAVSLVVLLLVFLLDGRALISGSIRPIWSWSRTVTRARKRGNTQGPLARRGHA
jgi:hypothetical protein